MTYFNHLLDQVNVAIAHMKYPAQPTGLYEPIQYVLALGGKRIRPVFLLLAYSMYRNDPERVMNAALGVETYHNYTLLHDDLMDRADMRRGKATVHKKWDNNTAILSGDSMLVLACQLILSVKSPKEHEIMELFIRTALEIGEGQQFDMNFETRTDVTEAEYIEMIRLKTSVLIACAIKMGAVLGGASADDAERLYHFGEKVGLAFQLQDDLLDVYGNPDIFGKRIGGDILCNKKTFMLINAYQKANEAQRQELERWMKLKEYVAEEKIKAVTQLYNDLSIRELCIERIGHYFNEAKDILMAVELPESSKQHLWEFAAHLINRKY